MTCRRGGGVATASILTAAITPVSRQRGGLRCCAGHVEILAPLRLWCACDVNNVTNVSNLLAISV